MDLERACGGCTACCKVMEVWEIGKAAGIWCSHCTIGMGCQRYDSRPEPCREFKCQWLMGLGEDEDRPDKSKIVVHFGPLEGIPELSASIFCLIEVSEHALPSKYT